MSTDDIYPRDAENRFRIYGVTDKGMTVLATASTPQGVGLALVTMHQDQKEAGRRLADLGRIGVMDVLGGSGPGGEWIVLPWDRGRPKP